MDEDEFAVINISNLLLTKGRGTRSHAHLFGDGRFHRKVDRGQKLVGGRLFEFHENFGSARDRVVGVGILQLHVAELEGRLRTGELEPLGVQLKRNRVPAVLVLCITTKLFFFLKKKKISNKLNHH